MPPETDDRDPKDAGLDFVTLAKYLAGECGEGEARAIEGRMAREPEFRGEVERMRAVWLAAVGRQPDTEAALRRVLAPASVVQPALRIVRDTPSVRVGTRWRTTWVGGHRGQVASRMAIAAGLLVAVGVTAVMVSGRRSPGRTPVAMREYATAAGERLNVTLVDGTQFALAPASRIRVPVTYGQVTRDVELEGEAFFRVVHDDARPFHVRARNADALDVGTAFDVRAYLGDTTVRLAVVEGRVAVRDTMRAVAGVGLGAGDLATVSGHGQIGTARNVDLAPYVGWTRGELVFRDTPLRDVVPVLERWYGVTIVVADPELASRPIYATYDMQSMTEVLTQVTATVGAHYTRRGKMITVDPGLTLSR